MAKKQRAAVNGLHRVIDEKAIHRHLGDSPSDFETVIRGHIWTEVFLDHIIGDALVEPDLLDVRMTYASKLSLAVALGLVERSLFAPLQRLNSLRNRLAHRPGATPTAAEVNALFSACDPDLRSGVDLLLAAADAEPSKYGRGRMVADQDARRLAIWLIAILFSLDWKMRMNDYERQFGHKLAGVRMLHALSEMATGPRPIPEERLREAGIPKPPIFGQPFSYSG